ncbi:uncharacterized protein A1O5_00945 [Cladophialophora psammophila CBS 110553]|uniref:Uncharacterized protein n=1 Tax=Cladophialophora psammophila CBS 110553 TaxID=1182543 RepID=W9X7J3_9EURO|nr:uncharacterized protein A1O5_00945 [Cladophialophora psammophila CBS 110553]EXJ76437.1 hypothetical protein A1O5_00945 [Cladophialophora psammophila CBS 110553]
MGGETTADKGLCEIVVERENQDPVTKLAKKDWQTREHSEITEACVESLGFSLYDQNGEKRKSLRLVWGPIERAKSLDDDFLIVPTGDHEIVLGLEAFDRWHSACNPGSYPGFMKKVPKEILARRESENKIRHEQEIRAEVKEWRELLQKDRSSPSTQATQAPASRL